MSRITRLLCTFICCTLGPMAGINAQSPTGRVQRLDRLVVVTAFDLVRCPNPIGCTEYAQQENNQFEYEITDRTFLTRIARELGRLQESEQDPMWVSMVLTGFLDKEKVFDLCTSHHFSNGYMRDGRRYASSPVLDSLIASALVRKIKEDDIRCTSRTRDCLTEPSSVALLLRDLNLWMSYLENRRYRQPSKTGS